MSEETEQEAAERLFRTMEVLRASLNTLAVSTKHAADALEAWADAARPDGPQ